jgi:hypothetical protein
MSRVNADVVIALLLMAVCVVLFAETFRYETLHLSIIGAKLWPRVVVVALFVLSALYLRQSLRASAKERASAFDLKAWLSANHNVIVSFGLFAAFLVSLPYLGMLIAGVAFVFATLAVLGPTDVRSHGLHAGIAVVSVGLMWAIFTFALGVILPQGEILRF